MAHRSPREARGVPLGQPLQHAASALPLRTTLPCRLRERAFEPSTTLPPKPHNPVSGHPGSGPRSYSAVARKLGLDRRTVRKYACARTWQEVVRRPPRKPSTLDPYRD